MAGRLATVRIIRNQATRYGEEVRSLGPWLLLAAPFWLWTARRAYQREQERQRLLYLAPVLKRRQLRRR